MPALLTYADSNIEKHVRLYGEIRKILGLPDQTIPTMETIHALLSTKPDKLVLLARIAGDSQNIPDPNGNTRLIRRMLITNIEDALLGLDQIVAGNATDPSYSIEDLMVVAEAIRKQKLDRTVKRQRIAKSSNIPPKIKARYFTGYPK